MSKGDALTVDVCCGTCRFHRRLLYACQAVVLLVLVSVVVVVWQHDTQLLHRVSSMRPCYTDRDDSTMMEEEESGRQATIPSFTAGRRRRRSLPPALSGAAAYEYLPTDGRRGDDGHAADWVLLPSYARVSMQALKEVCVSSLNYCDKVLDYNKLVGPQGPPGPVGSRGSIGPPGPAGNCIASCVGANAEQTPDNVTFVLTNQVEMHAVTSTPLTIMAAATHTPPGTNTTMEAQTTKKQRLRIGIKREKCFLLETSEPRVVGFRDQQNYFGSWMRDAAPSSGSDSAVQQRVYYTEGFQNHFLYEYANVSDLIAQSPSRVLTMPHSFRGTNHLVYDGAFFFHREGRAQIVRYDLNTGAVLETQLRGAAVANLNYLYAGVGFDTTNASMSYIDFASDENGVWVIYRKAGKRYAIVSKVDARTLRLMGTKRLKHLKPRTVGNCFVICGILYTIDSGHSANTTVGWAFDLYKRNAKPLRVNLPWKNIKGQTVMVNYNPNDKLVYVYDKGYLITVDVKLHY